MKPRAILSEVPPGSAINARLPGAYFHDSYVISVPDTTRTALSYFLTALANTPPWVNSLMALRNKMVRFVGLKDLGGLGELSPSKPASAYAPGDRVGKVSSHSFPIYPMRRCWEIATNIWMLCSPFTSTLLSKVAFSLSR